MLRRKIFLFFLLLFANTSFSQSIYSGGNSGGFSTFCYSQTNNFFLDIYAGGSSNSNYMACYSQADNNSLNLYSGGDASSFSLACYSQISNNSLNIYSGGNSNSSTVFCYNQIDNLSLDIYKGGNANSFSLICYNQIDNIALDIYKGGLANSYSSFCYTQLENIFLDIYKGGISNSYSDYCYTQLQNVLLSIYKGGDANTFSLACYTQLQNALLSVYKGGSADGFATTCYLQSSNPFYDIYKGGIADGFAFCRLGSVGGEVPLPIELIFFSAYCKENKAVLNWATASEINNDYFEIERGIDGFNWLSIGKIEGAGNSLGEKNYSFIDNEIFSLPLYYYRLKQVDFDGEHKYFDIIAVKSCNNNSGENFVIYPNPSKGLLNLAYDGNVENILSIDIYNTLGEKLLSLAGYRSTIDLSELQSGIYFVRLNFDSKTINKKTIIEK